MCVYVVTGLIVTFNLTYYNGFIKARGGGLLKIFDDFWYVKELWEVNK